MTPWFKSLRNRKPQRVAFRSRNLQAGMESLEGRVVMDGTIGYHWDSDLVHQLVNEVNTTLSWDPTCSHSIDANKVVTIEGGMSADQVSVIDDFTTGLVTINLQCGSGQELVWPFAQGEVQKIVFHGGWGNDSFVNLSMIPSVAYGDGGNDTLIGGAASDELHGGIGNDQLEANGMAWGMLIGDKLYGDEGDDTLIGGGWNDLLSGGSGNDQLFGGGGNDSMYGGSGNDLLEGGTGNDQMYGGSGWDQLFGEAGDDYLHGGNDGLSDQLTGGSGADTFVNEWRQKTRNGGWMVKELETVTDFALGDTLEWKQTPSRMIVP